MWSLAYKAFLLLVAFCGVFALFILTAIWIAGVIEERKWLRGKQKTNTPTQVEEEKDDEHVIN